MCIGGRAPAQGAHPSAVEALGVRNGQLPERGSLLTTPSPNLYGPRSVGVRAEGPGRVWMGPLIGQGISNVYQGGWNVRIAFWRPPPNLLLEDSVPVGHVPSRATQLMLRRTRIDSSPQWRLRTRWWGESCIVRRSCDRRFFARPMALCALQCVERLRPDRVHGGHARSSPTQRACNGGPGSRGAPGGRLADQALGEKFTLTKRR